MITKPLRFMISTALAAAVGGASAETPNQFTDIKRQLAAEQKEIQSAELLKLIEAERRKLTDSLKRLEELEARITALGGSAAPPRQAQRAPTNKAASQPQQVAQKDNPQPRGEKPRMRTREDNVRDAEKVAAISREVAGVLTPRGNLTIEPSIKYATTSSDRVFLEGFGPLILPAFYLGIIDIRETDRKTAVASLSARYGISNRLQVSARVPYVWRDDSTRSRPITQSLFGDEVFQADGMGIGDVEFAVDYQFNEGVNNWPFITGSLRVKAPTGTNPYEVDTYNVTIDDPNDTGDCLRGDDGQCLIQKFPKELATGTGTWSLQPSVTFLYPTDPAVFYGTLDYSFNLEEDFQDVGSIDPGDAFGISGGMGFGLNDRASFSLGFSYTHGFETKNNGTSLNGSSYDIAQILAGYSFRWSEDTTVNLTVGIGATDDAQDFEMTLRVPTNFVL
jgi:hypothetical protein